MDLDATKIGNSICGSCATYGPIVCEDLEHSGVEEDVKLGEASVLFESAAIDKAQGRKGGGTLPSGEERAIRGARREADHFTYAEIKEKEEDLKKLRTWHAKDKGTRLLAFEDLIVILVPSSCDETKTLAKSQP